MKQETERKRKASRVLSAKQKSQTVLALWSGRRSPASLMKELGVTWGAIHDWERRALSGMLTALDPKWKESPAAAESLPPRVEKLMERTLRPAPERTGVEPQ